MAEAESQAEAVNLATVIQEKGVLTKAVQKLQLQLVRQKLGAGTQAITALLTRQHVRATANAFGRFKTKTVLAPQLGAEAEQALAEGSARIRQVKQHAGRMRKSMACRWLLKAARRVAQAPVARAFRQWQGVMWLERSLASHEAQVEELKVTVVKAEGEKRQFSDRLRYNRDATRERLHKTNLRFGRDKVIHVLRQHLKHTLRGSFTKWHLHAASKKRQDTIRRANLKLRVQMDQANLERIALDRERAEHMRVQKLFSLHTAFAKWDK